MLTKTLIETALKAEMTDNLGYEAHDRAGSGSGNSRNGNFEQQLAKKRQRRVTVIDEKIIPLYAKGMSTREITTTIEDLYDAEGSPSLIPREWVIGDVIAWQARPLDGDDPIVLGRPR